MNKRRTLETIEDIKMKRWTKPKKRPYIGKPVNCGGIEYQTLRQIIMELSERIMDLELKIIRLENQQDIEELPPKYSKAVKEDKIYLRDAQIAAHVEKRLSGGK